MTTFSDRLVATLVIAAALFAPLPFGSQALFWSAAWIGVLALPAAMVQPDRLAPVARLACWALLATAATAAAVAIVHMQPPQDAGHWIWPQASQVLSEPLSARAGVSAEPPYKSLTPGLVAMLAFLAGLRLSRHRISSRRLLTIVAAVGAGYAILWLILHAADPRSVLWRLKTHHENVLTGTFLNRNMAAAFLGPPFVACAMLATDALSQRLAGIRLIQTTDPALRTISGPAAVTVMGGCIAMAILLTGSRSGVILAGAGALAASALAARPLFAELEPKQLRVVIVGWLTACLIFAAVAVAAVAARFDANEAVDQNRFAVYRLTLRMALDHPLIGVGFGQFGAAFQTYRDGSVPGLGVWDRAHNTYLQIAAEGGFGVLFAGLITLSLALAGLAAGALRQGRGRATSILGLVCLAMPAIHSCVDYPLQIAGCAIPIAVLVGYALGQRSGAGAPGTRGP